MRRIIAVLALLSTLGLTQAQAASLTPAVRAHTCRYNGVSPRNWTDWEVRATIRCAMAHYGVSLSTALYVAERESHLDERAYNSYSGASGLFQHLARYWGDRIHFGYLNGVAPAPSPFNARTNSLVTARMVATGGWGPWT